MFKKLLLAALVLVMCVGCVTAGDVIYEHDFHQSSGATFDYQVVYPGQVSGQPNIFPTCLVMDSIEENSGLHNFFVSVDADYFNPMLDDDDNIIRSHFDNGVNLKLSNGVVIIGNITHGYAYSADLSHVSYYIFVEDWDIGELTGNQYATFAELSGDGPWGFECAKSSTTELYGVLNGGEIAIAYYQGSVGAIWTIGYSSTFSYGDPDHIYFLDHVHYFWNKVYVEEVDGMLYKLTIQRENLPGWSGATQSRYSISSVDHVYVDQSTVRSINETFYIFDDCCEWLQFYCWDSNDFPFETNATDICAVPEPGYFDLSGYTRSITGNLIPGVLLTAQDEAEYSNNISFYEFENLDTGAFDLAWNKTGYHNDSVSMYVGMPGDYERDVYLIPLDALDEGEFGGVVYDWCTHQSIQGAYVYLFNETADSGSYAYSNKYGFYRFASMAEDLEYEISASKDGYDASIVHSFTFNESNVNETHCKIKNIWLLPEGGCPEDGGIPTPPPAPTPIPHEWTNEEIVSWLRVNLMGMFIIVLLFTFLWFLRKAGGSKR